MLQKASVIEIQLRRDNELGICNLLGARIPHVQTEN